MLFVFMRKNKPSKWTFVCVRVFASKGGKEILRVCMSNYFSHLLLFCWIVLKPLAIWSKFAGTKWFYYDCFQYSGRSGRRKLLCQARDSFESKTHASSLYCGHPSIGSLRLPESCSNTEACALAVSPGPPVQISA